ncbi:MAG: glutathione S-transferase family protein [Proteobacteria bacterium]|nr:glutathione S-transferase family protein [Pseudomonadota bacterium]
MLKIWGRDTSVNVQKVLWLVHELNLEYERHDVGGAFGGLDTGEYLAKNPNRRIPTIEDGGLVLYESNAIIRYLAGKYASADLWPADLAARAVLDQWMDWMQTTLYPEFITVFIAMVRTPKAERDGAAVEATAERLGKQYAILDRHLATRDFVSGGGFTAGDIPVGALCYRYYSIDIARPALPNVEAWYERLQERAPFRDVIMTSYESLRVPGT